MAKLRRSAIVRRHGAKVFQESRRQVSAFHTSPKAGPFSLLLLSALAFALLGSACLPAVAAASEEGLIAAYSFDEGEGEIAHDASGHSNNGVIEGAQWSGGKYGDALKFNAEEEDAVTIPASPELELSGELTLEAWVRPEEGGEYWQPLVSKQTPTFYSYQLLLAGGNPAGELAHEGSHIYSGPEGLPSHRWSHIAFTSDGEEARLYLNGELVESGPAVAQELGEEHLQIGANSVLGQYFSGLIDEVRVYDRALSGEEIREDKNTAIQTPPSQGPIASYSFDEGEGAIAHDSSGNGHDGEIEGAQWSGGKYGDALHFEDNESQCVTVPDSKDLQLAGGAFTLEAWLRPEWLHAWVPAIFKEGDAEWEFGYQLLAGGPEGPPGGLIEQPWSEVNGKAELPERKWSHLALTSDGETMSLYVDGELVETAPATDPQESEGPLKIGCSKGYGAFFGLIDEVRVYDRALDAEEIREDKNTAIQTPPSVEPVAAYSFDEGEGETLHDVTGNGNNGEIEGAEWVSGKYGSALKFNAEEEDVVEIPDSSSLDLEEFTLDAWVRPEENGLFDPVLAHTAPEGYGYALSTGTEEEGSKGNPWGITSWHQWSNYFAYGGEKLSPDSWANVAVTEDGEHIRLYVNGVLVDERESEGSPSDKAPLEIGGDTMEGWEGFFDGEIDEVRVYDRPLSAEEIRAVKKVPLGSRSEGPIASYSFDEGEGDVAHDDSGNGNEAQIEGAEWVSGKYGSALQFNAEEEDVVTIPDSAGLDLEDFTLEAWVNPDEDNPYGPILAHTAPEGYGYGLFTGSGEEGFEGNLLGFISFHQWVNAHTFSEKLPQDTWTHVALTNDGKEIRLYVNGVLVDERESEEALAGEAPLQIGGDTEPGWETFFDGKIDEVRVYRQALDGEEIEEDSETAIVPESSVASAVAYSFDEGEGTTVHNLSGRGHNGTVTGAEWSEPESGQGWSLSFDGKEDCVSVANAAELHLEQGFTFEAWMKPEASSEEEKESTQAIFASEGGSAGALTLGIGGSTPRHLDGTVTQKGSEELPTEVTDSTEMDWNKWSYVALTFNGATLRLYVDGEEMASSTITGRAVSSGDLTIGCSNGTSSFFHGSIDEVRIYSRALTNAALSRDEDRPVQPVHLLAFGQLAEASEEALVAAEQHLSLTAGSPGKIEALELRVDGELTRVTTRAEALEEGGSESCWEEICSLTYEYQTVFEPSIESGPHTVTVTAVSDYGQQAEFSKTVRVDAGVPLLEFGGKLFEDHGELSEESEQITVTAGDGEGSYASGISSVGIYVDGAYVAGSSGCTEGCPTEVSASYTYSEADWGDGPHELMITAVDGAGNEITENIYVNRSIASVEPSCESVSPVSYEEEKESGSAAIAAIDEVLPAATAPAMAGEEEEAEGEEASIDPTFSEGRSTVEGSSAFMGRGSVVGERVLPDGGAFTMGQGACLTPLQTTSSESSGSLLPESGAVLYTDTAPETDTIIRNNGLGATVVESFRGEKAPGSLFWQAGLEAGEELEALANGAVAVVVPERPDIPNGVLPEEGGDLENPEDIADTPAVLEAATYDLARANNEVEGEVLAVIPPPIVVGAEPSEVSTTSIEIGPGGNSIEVDVPSHASALVISTTAAAAAPDMCAEAFEGSGEYVEGCEAETGEAGERPYIDGMDWAPDGSFVFSAFWDEYEHYDLNPGESRIAPERTLYRASSDGSEVTEIETPGFEVLGSPKVAPDGEHIAFNGCSLVSYQCGIVVIDNEGDNGVLVSALPGPRIDDVVGFASNSSHVIYVGRETEGETIDEQLFSVNLSGGEKRQLTNISETGPETSSEISSETRPEITLGGTSTVRGINTNSAPAADPATGKIALEDWTSIYAMPSTGENVDMPEMEYLSSGSDPAYNPAGTKIAVSRDPTKGSPGIYIENADGSEQILLTKTPKKYEFRGIDPVFSSDGSEVAYIRNGMIYTVPTAGGESELRVDGGTSGVNTLAQAIEASDPSDVAMVRRLESAVASSVGSTIEEVFHEAATLFEEVSLEQAEFCAGHSKECSAFYQDRALALAARGALFNNAHKVDRSTMGNAFQHGLWSALMVRDSESEVDGVPAGLWIAVTHESAPYTWDARQDIVNDVVGYSWFVQDGVEIHELPGGEIKAKYVDKLQVCQGLLPKGKHAIFIGGKVNPFWWIKNNNYHFDKLIYRKLRSDKGYGSMVWPTGRTCADVWPKMPH